MGRSQESFHKKEVRSNKEKKRKEKEKKRLARKDNDKSNPDDMIAYVDEYGMISSTPPDPKNKQEVKLEDIEIVTPNRESRQDPDALRKGVVTFFNDAKGYGFIQDSDTKENIFVHINNVLEEVKKGNVVNYKVEMGQKGLSAIQVKPLK